MFQRLLMQFFEGIVSIASHRKWGNLQGSSCSHSQDIPCSTLPVCESLQKEKQVMPRCHRAQNVPQNCQLTVCIAIISVNYGYCYSYELPRLPRSDVHPGYRAVENSTLNCRCALAQSTTRAKMRGSIPFSRME